MSNRFSHGHALIVGIANYPKVRKLPEVVLKDARDVANILQSQDYCAYPPENIQLLLDGQATSQGIREGIKTLAESTGPDSTAILYFSGHGGRVENGPHTETYLIPFNCDPGDLQNTAIASAEFTTLLSTIRAQRLVVILDACHAAGAGDVKAIDPLPEMKAGFTERAYNELANGAGRVLMASSRATEASLVVGGKNNSLFTHYLLEALRGGVASRGDGKVRVFDVFHFVSDKVPAEAPAQHPIFKAHDVDSNFPLALYQGGKAVQPEHELLTSRPDSLVGQIKVQLVRRLVDRWSDLATYFDIPFADQARFPKGDEPRAILNWLEQRNRIKSLRDAFNFLGWDDLIDEMEAPHHTNKNSESHLAPISVELASGNLTDGKGELPKISHSDQDAQTTGSTLGASHRESSATTSSRNGTVLSRKSRIAKFVCGAAILLSLTLAAWYYDACVWAPSRLMSELQEAYLNASTNPTVTAETMQEVLESNIQSLESFGCVNNELRAVKAGFQEILGHVLTTKLRYGSAAAQFNEAIESVSPILSENPDWRPPRNPYSPPVRAFSIGVIISFAHTSAFANHGQIKSDEMAKVQQRVEEARTLFQSWQGRDKYKSTLTVDLAATFLLIGNRASALDVVQRALLDLGEPEHPSGINEVDRMNYAALFMMKCLLDAQNGEYEPSLAMINKVADYLSGLDADDDGWLGTMYLWVARYEKSELRRAAALDKAIEHFRSKDNDNCLSCFYGRACALAGRAALEADQVKRAQYLSDSEGEFITALTRLKTYMWELDVKKLRTDPFLKDLLDRPNVQKELEGFDWKPSKFRGNAPSNALWFENPPWLGMPFAHKTHCEELSNLSDAARTSD